MEELPIVTGPVVARENFLVAHYQVFGVILAIVVIVGGYFAMRSSGEIVASTGDTPTSSGIITTDSGVVAQESATGALVVEPKEPVAVEVTKTEESKDIDTLLGEFIQEATSGSGGQAITIYETMIAMSDEDPFFTGKDHIESAKATELEALEANIAKTVNSKLRSDFLAKQGILEYDIGDSLYYQDTEKYGLVFLYYSLRAMRSLDVSIVLYDNALSHRYLGVILLDLGGGKDAEAIAELKKSLAMNSGDDITYYRLGNAFNGLKEYKTAIGYYLSGAAINPNNELLQVNLGSAYFKHGDRAEGFALLNTLITTCVNYCNIANHNLAMNMNDEKIKDYPKILALLEDAILFGKMKGEIYRDAYREKGKIYYLQGDTQKAIENLKLSLNDPNHPETGRNMFNLNDNEEYSYYLLTKISIESKDIETARKYLYQGLKKFPKDKNLKALENQIMKP